MTKDRIDQLRNGIRGNKKINDQDDIEACRESDEEACLNPKSSKAVIITSKTKNKDCLILDEIFKKVNDIIVSVESLKENIVQLQKKHVLLQQSTRIDPVLKAKTEELNEEIKLQANATRVKINGLEQHSTGNEHGAVDRVIRTQKSMLYRMLQETIEFYENSLIAHKQIYEGIIKKQLHIVVKKVISRVGCVPAHKEVSEDELLAIIDTQDTAVFVDDYIKETSEAMQSLQDARDRHKEILTIERDIVMIRDMFCDMALNITKQGEMIDTIEYHIGNGIVLAHKGNKKLTKAHKLRNATRKKKVYIIVILTTLSAILLLWLVSALV